MPLTSQIREKLDSLPHKPGCYLMRNRSGAVIYVGKALSLRRRVQSYFRPAAMRAAPPKLRSLIHSVADIEVVIARDETDALLTESNLIKQHRPRFNILLRDDKRYLALRADPHDPVPRITTCRIVRQDRARYFGPFPSSVALRAALDFTEKRYGLRKCSPIRPDAHTFSHCINDIVRFCSAPCVGRISPEAYRERFEEACAFLRGERPAVTEEVRERMRAAAQAQDYERAAAWRDTWFALRDLIKRRARAAASPALRPPDARAALVDLQRLIGLPSPPALIEGFDVSALFGVHAVAALVAAVNGLPDRRHYRRFRIQTHKSADDPAALAEAIARHYSRAKREGRPLPDLLLVDGGIAQVRAARRALANLGLADLRTIGLAKRMEKIVLDNGSPGLSLPRHSPALHLLMRLRDEAHRFAVDYHRRLRNRLIRESALDEIHGIGPVRKAALLRHFGSVNRLAQAKPEAITAVPGINLDMAHAILRAVTPLNPPSVKSLP